MFDCTHDADDAAQHIYGVDVDGLTEAQLTEGETYDSHCVVCGAPFAKVWTYDDLMAEQDKTVALLLAETQ